MGPAVPAVERGRDLFPHTAPDPTDEQREQLAARGIAVVDGEVAAPEVIDDRLTGVRLTLGLEPTEQQVDAEARRPMQADPAAQTNSLR